MTKMDKSKVKNTTFDHKEFLRRVLQMFQRSEHPPETVALGMTIVEIRGVARQLERIADSLESIDKNTKDAPWKGGPR